MIIKTFSANILKKAPFKQCKKYFFFNNRMLTMYLSAASLLLPLRMLREIISAHRIEIVSQDLAGGLWIQSELSQHLVAIEKTYSELAQLSIVLEHQHLLLEIVVGEAKAKAILCRKDIIHKRSFSIGPQKYQNPRTITIFALIKKTEA